MKKFVYVVNNKKSLMYYERIKSKVKYNNILW